MSTELIKEKEQRILDNQLLVKHIVYNCLGIRPNSRRYEECCSIGTIGLVKAANTYNETKGIAFSTYAVRCIKNEILLYYKKSKKYLNDVSLDASVTIDNEGHSRSLGEVIEDAKSNFVEEVINKKEFVNVVNIILNYLEGRERIIVLYIMGNMSQTNIAKVFKTHQSVVSRTYTRAIKKVRTIFNDQVYFQDLFSMKIIGEKYIIAYEPKDISKLKDLCDDIRSDKSLSEIKIISNKKRMVMHMPADPDYFSLVAEIIKKIDSYSQNLKATN